MNKKKFLAMLVSLCLVAALGVGATLALFSDTTNELTNTFTVGGGITAHLEEVTDKDGTTEEIQGENGEDDGKDYAEALPGATLVKEPYMVIEANSSNCFALIQVSGIEALEALNNGLSFEVGAFNAKWEKIADLNKAAVTTAKDGIYILVDDDAKPVIFETSTAAQNTLKLFETVTLDNIDEDQLAALKAKLTEDGADYSIKLVGCAIQADNAEKVAADNGKSLKAQLLDEAKFAK